LGHSFLFQDAKKNRENYVMHANQMLIVKKVWLAKHFNIKIQPLLHRGVQTLIRPQARSRFAGNFRGFCPVFIQAAISFHLLFKDFSSP
jgi:hypothetical protein